MKKAIIFFLSLLTLCNFSPVFAEDNVDDLSESPEASSPFLTSVKDESSSSAILPDIETTKSAAKVKGFLTLGLPEVSILPSSPIYFLKTWWEQIVLFFTFDAVAKNNLLLKYAENRLSEAYKLIEQKNFEKAEEALRSYNNLVIQVSSSLSSLKESNGEDLLQLVRKIESNTVKQQGVVDYFVDKVGTSSEYYEVLKDLTVTSFKSAIDSLVESNIATPSYELKKRITEMINGTEYDPSVIQDLETRMNEKLRREIRKIEEN